MFRAESAVQIGADGGMTGVASDLANMVDMIGQSLQVIQVDDGIRALQAADVTDGSIVGGIFPAGQVPFQGGQIGDGCQPGSIGYWLLVIGYWVE